MLLLTALLLLVNGSVSRIVAAPSRSRVVNAGWGSHTVCSTRSAFSPAEYGDTECRPLAPRHFYHYLSVINTSCSLPPLRCCNDDVRCASNHCELMVFRIAESPYASVYHSILFHALFAVCCSAAIAEFTHGGLPIPLNLNLPRYIAVHRA